MRENIEEKVDDMLEENTKSKKANIKPNKEEYADDWNNWEEE